MAHETSSGENAILHTKIIRLVVLEIIIQADNICQKREYTSRIYCFIEFTRVFDIFLSARVGKTDNAQHKCFAHSHCIKKKKTRNVQHKWFVHRAGQLS